MTQAQLNRAVARVTGESVGMVEQLGFNLIVVPDMQRTPRAFHRGGKRNRSRWTERRQSRSTRRRRRLLTIRSPRQPRPTTSPTRPAARTGSCSH